MKKQTTLLTLSAFVLITVLASCAPTGYSPERYGFLYGILHGFILPFALIGKLFGMDHGIYAENNTGAFYWAGFIIGLFGLGFGGFSARR